MRLGLLHQTPWRRLHLSQEEVLEFAAYDRLFGLPDRQERKIPLAPYQKTKQSVAEQIVIARTVFNSRKRRT